MLADAGLVAATRHGRERRYEAVPGALDDARAWIDEVGRRWDERLGALRRRVAREAGPAQA